jgi:antitoxin component HigA of HigAB toxin-antitoxin module
MPSATKSAPRPRDRYMELVGTFPLRPIRSTQTHEQAKRMLRSLAGERGRAVADYKDVLVKLIMEYEQNAGHRMDTSGLTPADVVRHLLQERNMSVNAFAKAIGTAQSTVSDMLNGKRDWSKSAIKATSAFFGLNPRLFLS